MKAFFDCGANVGQTFDDYLLKNSRFDGWDVFCFEPSPRHLFNLQAELSKHTLRYKLHLCPFGLRGSSEILPFYQKDDGRGDSFEPYLASDHETTNVSPGYHLHIPSFSAADFILGVTKPGDEVVLKLDVEGSEYDLLTDLLGKPKALSRISEILVEWHTIKPEKNTVYSAAALTAAYAAVGVELKQWMF